MLKVDINLLFNIINILIIFVIVRVLLFKPVKKVIAKRREEIDAQFAKAKEAEDAAEGMKEEYAREIAGLDEIKAQAVEEARGKANSEYDRIVTEANAESERIIEAARRDAENEKDRVILEAREEIASMIVDAVGKVAVSEQSADADRKIYDEFLAKTGEQN